MCFSFNTAEEENQAEDNVETTETEGLLKALKSVLTQKVHKVAGWLVIIKSYWLSIIA